MKCENEVKKSKLGVADFEKLKRQLSKIRKSIEIVLYRVVGSKRCVVIRCLSTLLAAAHGSVWTPEVRKARTTVHSLRLHCGREW